MDTGALAKAAPAMGMHFAFVLPFLAIVPLAKRNYMSILQDIVVTTGKMTVYRSPISANVVAFR